MNKFIQKIILAAAVLLATHVHAQNDLVSSTRSIVLTTPTLLTAANANLTNGPFDLHSYMGRAFIDVQSFTNAGGALTCTIQSSPDTTNWTSLTNFALINSTTQFIYTNSTYNSIAVSNNWLLPGTITTASAGNSSNAFAGTWLNYATVPYTNSGAVTITAKGVYRIGFNAPSLTGRYLQIYYTPTGSSSNDTISATLTGRRQTEVQ